MNIMVEDIINFKILSYYQDLYNKNPTDCDSPNDFKEMFDISYNELLGHVIYLRNVGLLECNVIQDDAMCRITAMGIDSLRHPETYKSKPEVHNIVILGDVKDSNILQGDNIRIINSFNRIYKEIDKSDLDNATKKELHDNIREIKDEFRKEKPKLDKIKTLLNDIKEKSPSISSILTPVIVSCIQKFIGID